MTLEPGELGREQERRPKAMEIFVVENAGALGEAMDERKPRREGAGSLSGVELYVEENPDVRVEITGEAGQTTRE